LILFHVPIYLSTCLDPEEFGKLSSLVYKGESPRIQALELASQQRQLQRQQALTLAANAQGDNKGASSQINDANALGFKVADGDELDREMLGRAMSDRSWEENEELDENVDEMKIQTMYKMVDDCHVNVGGRVTTKKVLYLTNKQAALFDDAAMERCLQALDIGDPKFIIMLSTSTGVRSQMMKAHAECIGTATAEFPSDYDIDYMTAEIDVSDERAVESQLLLFMRTCVLPVAMQTHALIII